MALRSGAARAASPMSLPGMLRWSSGPSSRIDLERALSLKLFTADLRPECQP